MTRDNDQEHQRTGSDLILTKAPQYSGRVPKTSLRDPLFFPFRFFSTLVLLVCPPYSWGLWCALSLRPSSSFQVESSGPSHPWGGHNENVFSSFWAPQHTTPPWLAHAGKTDRDGPFWSV